MTNLLKNEVRLPDIVLGQDDYVAMHELADSVGGPLAEAGERLMEEIERAEILPQSTLPSNRAALGSSVTFRDETGSVRSFILVLPSDADVDGGRLSILTPLGTAIIGLSTGQKFPWVGRDGRQHILTVMKVRRP